MPGLLEIPHRIVDDPKQTLNNERLRAWAGDINVDDLNARLTAAEADINTAEANIATNAAAIAAMPGSFANDSISPAQVNVTQPADVVSFPATVLNSTTFVSLPSQIVSTAGIYVVAVSIDVASLGTVANDLFSFRLLIDLNNKDNAYAQSPTTIFREQINFVYVGQVNSTIVPQGNRGSGSGTAIVNEVTIRSARIG
jgi:hypothetical protein